jgi:capsular polysaccharide biosynthesis protein
MELREYWRVIRRRAWIIAIVFGLTVLVSGLLLVVSPRSGSGTGGQASAVVAIREKPESPTGGNRASDDYSAYQASDYLSDDVVWLLQSPQFLQTLHAQAPSLSADIDASSVEVKKARRVLTITVSSRSPEAAAAVAEAAVASLTADGGRYLSGVAPRGAEVTVLYAPSVQQSGTGNARLRALLDLALRALLGLLAGVALAFFVDYLDDTLRSAADVEQTLGLPVLGEVTVGRKRSSDQSRT